MLTIITLQATTPELYILNDEQIKILKEREENTRVVKLRLPL